MRKSVPIHIIVHMPKTSDGQHALAKRVSEVHADTVLRQIRELNCPVSQKQALLEAVIKTVKERSRPHSL